MKTSSSSIQSIVNSHDVIEIFQQSSIGIQRSPRAKRENDRKDLLVILTPVRLVRICKGTCLQFLSHDQDKLATMQCKNKISIQVH